ncbi:MAG: hypothetical protein AAB539_01000 [Patescibacteria group bacterium]
MKKETLIVLGIAAAIIIGNWLFLGGRETEEIDEGASSQVPDFLTATSTVLPTGDTETGSSVSPVADALETAPVPAPSPAVLPPAAPAPVAAEPVVSGSVRSSAKNTLTVRDQESGKRVELAGLTLEKIAWVVVYEDREGAPWNILGAQRLRPHDTAGGVDLLRATADGKRYHVILHEDDGDATFDFRTDAQARDEAGKAIGATFVARAAGPVIGTQ